MVAQFWLERFPVTEEVAGSSPVHPAYLIAVAIKLPLASSKIVCYKSTHMVAKKKTTKKVSRKNLKAPEVFEATAPKNKFAKDISTQLKLSESYISLLLGAVVVLGISVVFFLFVKNSGLEGTTPIIDEKDIPQLEAPVNEMTYTLQEGEGLWDVAVKFYGDGFRWIDIAKANGLENNPDNIAPGMKLIIPKAQ